MIEASSREVADADKLSLHMGRLHELLLSSCLAQRYAPERPLSLTATLVFEQNYGGIEGDSASLLNSSYWFPRL